MTMSICSFGRDGPYPTISRENLDLYVSKFQEKAIGCCDPIDEEVLMNVRLHAMLEE